MKAQAHTKQGKRKSASKPEGKKKRELLSTTFQCLFCNHENSVSVKIDKKASTGELTCKVCGQTFQTVTNYLSAPIDVYSDWVDACDSVAKQAAQSTSQPRRDTYSGTASQSRSQAASGAAANTAADDGFIDDDELDAEADYADE
ncbi:Elf1-domain-containing protein [Aureobasidium sp. EXF-12298]|nr:Elf1-domain-containing protein [Aureobasidium sp. EXF-12298]